jgi:hypothetical protein
LTKYVKKVENLEDRYDPEGKQRMKRYPCTISLLALIFLLSAPLTLLSQTTPWSDVKVEVRTALGYQKALLDSSYLHQYSPPFLSGAYESTAQQTLRIEGETAWGMSLGVAYFPLPQLGCQFLFDYGKPKIGGQNSAYEFSLNYALTDDAGAPPYPYIYEREHFWPTTKGNLSQLCFSLDAVIRLPVAKWLAINASVGPTLFLTSGKAASIGYSFFRIEADSFIEETYQIPYGFGPVTKLGVNVGIDLSVVLVSNLCATLDVRGFLGPKYNPRLELDEESWQLSQPLDEVKAAMQLGDIQVNPSFYRLDIGLKYLF